MSTRDARSDTAGASVPFGQRLFDNWPVLMLLGLLVMFVIYTGWGLWEIVTMPPATLP